MRGQDTCRHLARRPSGLIPRLRLAGGKDSNDAPIAANTDSGGQGGGAIVAAFQPVVCVPGPPLIAPEKLLRALLLMVLYSIRSERRLMEELEYNLLYRSFVGLAMDESIWDATTFSKNRERFIDGEVKRRFFGEVLKQARQRDLVSEEHFSVDGTLIEAWASLKSFRLKNDSRSPPDDAGNASINFRGERRSNETHESQTDPAARLGAKWRRQGSQIVLLRQCDYREPAWAGGRYELYRQRVRRNETRP